uniref:Uncharacterized protein n=1 Tax=Avena sativa TaxID=4498 RepID=A0ACD5WWT3_AVESA
MASPPSSAAAAAVGRAVEEVRSTLNEHADVLAELFGRVSTELRGGFVPAVDSFIGFFHAIDWKEPWVICMISFHVILLLVTIISRRNINFQLILSALIFWRISCREIEHIRRTKLEELLKLELL